MSERETLRVSIAASPASVRLLRSEVLRWLGKHDLHDEELEAAIGLATSEAVANVVRHAYRDAGPGGIELEATVGTDEVVISVGDRGSGLTAGGGHHTGLGLPVIGRVASGVTVSSDPEGTTVTMRFGIGARRPALRLDRLARATHAIAG